MIKLSLKELKEVEKICYETGAEYFDLTRDSRWSVGGVLKMQYDTFVSDYPAKMSVEIKNTKDW
jgi:hypothetical protein